MLGASSIMTFVQELYNAVTSPRHSHHYHYGAVVNGILLCALAPRLCRQLQSFLSSPDRKPDSRDRTISYLNLNLSSCSGNICFKSWGWHFQRQGEWPIQGHYNFLTFTLWYSPQLAVPLCRQGRQRPKLNPFPIDQASQATSG